MPYPQTSSKLRRIGEYLPCPPSNISWALSIQSMESASGNAKPLGEILVERELVGREILEDALELQRIDQLRMLSVLADMSQEELAWIGQGTDLVRLENGETLLREGQRGNSAYVLLSGRMLLSHSADRTEHPAGVVLPGEVLGEDDYFTDGTRRCSAYAIESSVLLKIPYDLLPRHADRNLKPVLLYSVAHIVRRACEVLRADRAYYFVRNPKTGELTARAGEAEAACGFKVMAGTDIAGWVALTRKSVNLQEAYLDPRFDPAMDVLTGYWTRTLLAVPVLDSRGEVLGVLAAVNKQAGQFDADDEALLHALAHQYAPALLHYCC